MKALCSFKTLGTLTHWHSVTSQKTWIMKSLDVSYKDLCDYCLHIYVTRMYCVFVTESNVTCAIQLHRPSTIWQCLMQRFGISAHISVWCHFKGSIPRMHSQAMNQLQYQQVRLSFVFTGDQHCSRYSGDKLTYLPAFRNTCWYILLCCFKTFCATEDRRWVWQFCRRLVKFFSSTECEDRCKLNFRWCQ
jgi:hypothetical protein